MRRTQCWRGDPLRQLHGPNVGLSEYGTYSSPCASGEWSETIPEVRHSADGSSTEYFSQCWVWFKGQDMTLRKPKFDLLPVARRDAAAQAIAILAVDGIKASDMALELLAQCEAGTMTYDEAREVIIARALAMAAAQNVKQED